MGNNKNYIIQFRYKPNTKEGQICDYFRDLDNKSKKLRAFIVNAEGYDFLKQQGASSSELRHHCINSIQYFAALIEVQKAYLAEQGGSYPINASKKARRNKRKVKQPSQNSYTANSQSK